MEESKEIQQLRNEKSCGKSVKGHRSIGIQDSLILRLSKICWSEEEVLCGQHQRLLGKDTSVICWDCALSRGLVEETEDDDGRLLQTLRSGDFW